MNPFQSLRDYELFVYTLPQRFASITIRSLTPATQRSPAPILITSTFHQTSSIIAFLHLA